MSRYYRQILLLGMLLISSSASLTQVNAQDPSLGNDAETTADPVIPTGMMTDEEFAESSAAAHNAWMLVCCALVLFMTAPGLAMFYGGLVRRKNVLSVMMQCIFLMGLMTIIWATYGYSLAFGGEGLSLIHIPSPRDS